MFTILSLCDRSGTWSAPYAEAGYDVRCVDLANGCDVRLIQLDELPPVHGILAAPPCTHLASSGARWWASKGEQALLDALSVVDACLRLVVACNPMWWALENPTGRLRRYLGAPEYSFDPCDHGDPYTKRTHLWGRFNHPARKPVQPTEGSKMHRMAPSPERAFLRAITPAGFARAFFEANP